jgi:hypothetical protein
MDPSPSSQVPESFVGDEFALAPCAFSAPIPPMGGWRQLDEVVEAYRCAANRSDHRFKVSYSTSGHYSKKLGKNLVDHATLYCNCPKESRMAAECDSAKPQHKTWCPWQVKLRIDKSKMEWLVVSSCNTHTCQALPNLSITATGMHLLRHLSDLTADEVLFIHEQIEHVGTYPRLIQWNFTRRFTLRKPTSELISSMRIAHEEKQYGLQSDSVKRLQDYLAEQEHKGGVGTVEWDKQLKISRLVVCRHDMIPYLEKYSRVLICDATHGITMSKFRLFTIVVVDSLLHSTLVAYGIVRSESAEDLRFIFESLRLTDTSNIVFITDDNPAARLVAAHFSFKHILCQWHYAKNWVKKCNEAKMTKQNQYHFGLTFYHLLTSVTFDDDAHFNYQLNNFCAAVYAACPGMDNWCARFKDDHKLACEYHRQGLYCAGDSPPLQSLVYHIFWYTSC